MHRKIWDLFGVLLWVMTFIHQLYNSVKLFTQLLLHDYGVYGVASAFVGGTEILSADQIIIYNWFINLITAQAQNDRREVILQV